MIKRFLGDVKRFLGDKKANFAIMLSLAAMPFMLTIGMAVDYTAISRYQSKMQNHLDAALLSTGESYSTLSETELRAKIQEFLLANAGSELFSQIDSLKVTLGNSRESLTANARGSIDTSFMMLAGINELDFDVTAQIRASSGPLEVALVLDNTYSMGANNKMDDLKSAAEDFVNILMPTDSGGDTKIGVVPFSKYVNVGMHNRNAPWIDVPADYTKQVCNTGFPVLREYNCREVTRLFDGVPVISRQCDYVYGNTEVETCNDVEMKWSGCVGSRPEPLDLEDRSYKSNKVPGVFRNCGRSIVELTDQRQDVLFLIRRMSLVNYTYIPAGLTWGLRVLSSDAPFTGGATDAQAQAGDTKKVLVLMTDGANQASKEGWDSPFHDGKVFSYADDRTKEACNVVKNENITVFTITFGIFIPSSIQNLMKQCATKPEYYIHAPTGAYLDQAFKSIAGVLSNFYLSM